ncbi:protein-disulfide reductase DsbD family protein [Flavisolibacter nicotianae]|uniref:protein-disulfide reductase DsbD family protein n=1 Tax=Flavisolibacter nicotianae TaxID=2364882 RepID=UPI000EB4807C|nr:cytochrome c biogenesis protein CcdA [Flavisolibacter nicotianae]
MRYLNRVLVFLAAYLFMTTAQAQNPVQFRFTQEAAGKDVLLKIKAVVPKGSEIVSVKPISDEAPINTQIRFDSSAKVQLKDSVKESGLQKQVTEADFNNALVTYYSDSVEWQQRLQLPAADSTTVKGTIAYFVKSNGAFNSYEEPFAVKIHPSVQSAKTATIQSKDDLESRSLGYIFLISFLGGFIALVTPCVFSMVPVTVGFFTKRSKSREQGIRNAIYYSVSIILIFTLLGFLVTLIFGPTALNKLATNWIANLLFFLIFLVFGISFLGAFDIQLPSSWQTAADSKANTSNFTGIFFMALTLALVSFSCTGPIIGNLIVLASKGSYFGPLVGMFGFSVALALPFTLFALFPQWINSFGKAGGWLNSVKVALGFLELALALKFLSNADLAKGWRLLDREIFLSLWIVLFGLLGFYILGKIKFHHDSDLPKNDFEQPYVSIPRLFFAIVAFAFTVYMVPGLWGAPLKGISAFLPPYGTQDFSNSGGTVPASTSADGEIKPAKYVKELSPYEPEVAKKAGLVTFYDYDEALAAARKAGKPLMLDFTGINCINCRKMEAQVWSQPEVMKRLKENFIIASLYTDVQNIYLPEAEEFDSKELGEHVNTVGEKFSHLEVSRYGVASQPFYIFLDTKEQKLAPDGYPYDPDVQKFIQHLDNVVAEYKKRKS